MGLLDSMFGGGTKLGMSLDTPQSSAGGVVGGKISLHGGKKPMKLTELTVKLLFVSVHSEHPASKKLLTQLVQSPYSGVAEAARDALTR